MHRPDSPRAQGWRAGVAAVAIAVFACISGCVVAPAPAPFVGEVVATPPPVPQAEVIGVAPAPGYIWIGGFWNWVGGRHVWVPGRWEAPRPGYYWEPHAWVHVGNGWHLREGHWARR